MNELTIGDHVGYGGTTYKGFSQAIANQHGPLTLRINSPGGDVFDGFGIANLVRARRATVVIDGLAASIASVIAIAGQRVKIAANAHVFVHLPFTFAAGDAGDMRDAAELLDKMTGTIARSYSAKTGKDDATVRKWMKDEKWFDAEEALANGLVDEIIPESDAKVFACLNLAGLPNVPQALTARISAKAPDLRAQHDELLARYDRERRLRITAAVQKCNDEARIFGDQVAGFVERCMKDESFLAELQALPSKPPGGEPIDILDPERDSGGDFYALHLAALKRQRGIK